MAGTHFQGPLYVNISGEAYERGVPYVLLQTAAPVFLLSSATFADTTGSITGITTLPYDPTNLGVVQVYMFAGAGLSAGLYYARFSSTTACQLYERVDSNPVAPGVTKPSGITVGAYAGGTSEVTLRTVTVPGGALGANGSLRLQILASVPNNANNKILRSLLSGTSIGTKTMTTAATTRFSQFVFNRGATNRQIAPSGSPAFADGDTTAPVSTLSVATDAAFNITFTGQLAAAADFIIYESLQLVVSPS